MFRPLDPATLYSEQFLMNFFQPDVTDGRGNTPFLEACRYGNFYAAERLLRQGADPLAHNRAGLNAWDVLAEALAGVKQQKGNKPETSHFSVHPREYELQEPEEAPADDGDLYELVRLLHAHSIPARHPEKPSPISWRPQKDIRWKVSPSAPSPIYGWRRASPWKSRNCSRTSVL